MSELLTERIGALSPEQRRQFESLLAQRDIQLGRLGIFPVDRDRGRFRLSFAQRRLWFIHQLEPESTAYNLPSAVRIEGDLEPDRLAKVLGEIIRRHESLRTLFDQDDDGEPYQYLLDHLEVPLVQEDCRDAPDPETAARQFVERTLNRPFDLTTGPLIRAVLARLGSREWIMAVAMHHIVSDGWSLGIFLNEWMAGYTGSIPEEAPASRTGIGYVDFAEWQRHRHDSDRMSDSEDFWRAALMGGRPPKLPWSRTRSASNEARGLTVATQIPAVCRDRLKTLALETGTTLFEVLTTAFTVLMHRLTHETDICIGTPLAGRTRQEVEPLIGLFVNTLLLRTRIDGLPTFAEVLASVSRNHRAAQQHAELPFERVVETLLEGQARHDTPLNRINFAFLATHFESRERDGLRITPYPVEPPEVAGDLTIYVNEVADGLAIRFQYREAAFEPGALERLGQAYRCLLEAVPNQADRPIHRLPTMDSDQSAAILAAGEADRPPLDLGPDPRLHDMVAEQARRTPDRTALRYQGERLSYREMAHQADNLARVLAGHGVGTGCRVAVHLERSPALPIAILAVIKTGAAFLPMDPGYPAARRAFMLQDSGAPLLLVHRDVDLDFAVAPQVTVLAVAPLLENDSASVEPAPSGALDRPHPDHPAYLIYTSGSTGNPKGTLVSHRNVTRLVAELNRALDIDREDTFLLKTTCSFDPSIWEMFGPLTVGASLAILPEGTQADTFSIAESVRRYGVTVLQVVPSILALMVETGDLRRCEGLRLLCSGGESLSAQLANRCRAQSPARLVNLYGPTEATIWITTWACPPDGDCERVAIGRALPGNRTYVLDTHLNPVPAGIGGELYLAGDQIAQGYANRPSDTATQFRPDPFSGVPGARMYATGDAATMTSIGALHFHGRLDRQLKLQGVRIEPGEIENALARHDAVSHCIVVVRTRTNSQSSLAAYYQGRETARDDLIAHLEALLPAAMIPTSFVYMDAFPRLGNGKVDRRALPDPRPQTADPNRPLRAPRTDAERVTAAIWAEALGREEIGIHQNYFELGGHSLMAMTIVARMRKAFDQPLPLKALFDHPTIATLTAHVTSRANTAGADEAGIDDTIEPDLENRGSPFPLNDVQQAYFAGRQGAFELGNVATHIYLELDCRDLDTDRLKHALQQMLERHDMLRAVVLPSGEQRILERVPDLQLPILDLSTLPGAEREAALAEIRDQMSHEVIDIGAWPTFHVRASRLDGRLVRLHLSLDILFLDAWSIRLLGGELYRLYRNPESEPPPLTLSFRDYVLAEERLKRTEAYEAALRHWQRRVRTLPAAPELPLAKSAATVDRPHFERRHTELSAGQWRHLRQLAADEGVTPSVLLLTVYAETLARWSASPHFTLNLTVFNRRPLHPEVNDLVGDFTSLTLVEVDLGDPSPIGERMRRVQRTLWDEMEYGVVNGVQVLRELARARGNYGAAQMPVVFTSTLTGQSSADAELAEDFQVGYTISQTPQVRLDCQVAEVDGKLGLVWDAVEELFPQDLLDDMFHAMAQRLAVLAEHVPAVLGARDALPLPDHQRRLIAAANATETPIPETLLHLDFEAQCRTSPEAPAIIFEDETWTYDRLNRLANQLAEVLGERRSDELVAVLLPKGPVQIAAVLAVLKAGAAYLPIDPTLPENRIAHLLEVGLVRRVLCQAGIQLPDGSEAQAVFVDRFDPLSDGAENPKSRVRPTDLAYVIFTSGTTGFPKGVVIEHRAANNTLRDINQRFQVGPEDRVLGLSSLSFDLSVWDIFGILSAGGCLVLPAPERSRDPGHWLELIERHRITLWNSVPALMDMLVEFAEAIGQEPRDLRAVLMSGDWIPVNLPDRIRSLNPHTRIVSLGGATEASIWSIFYPIERVDPTWKSVPYGKALANQSFHVLDARLDPCPVWCPGRLYIGGIGVARGYWRDPEKTAASFIVHPTTGERLYHTGDWGRLLPDGNIEFLGRRDLQVKLRGFRIELGEIESTLARHPAVESATALIVGDGDGRQLVACIVPQDKGRATTPAKELETGEDGVILDAEARARFKRGRPGLRRFPADRPRTALARPELTEAFTQPFLRRRSQRRFSEEPVTRARLAGLLTCLLGLQNGDTVKYRYGSAGGLYPVQTYLHLRPGRIEGLAPGTYYHDPATHELVLLTADVDIPETVHTPWINQPMYRSAAFSIFLVSDRSAIAPLYGGDAERFALLEAGLATQLLETEAPNHDLGLCQIGALSFDAIRPLLLLGPDHDWVHCLIGGVAAPVPAKAPFTFAPSVPAGDREHTGPLDAQLTDYLKTQLPDYMVPNRIELMADRPLSPNGKVDRKAIVAALRHTGPKRDSARPRSGEAGPVQTILAVMQEILELDEVDRDRNFFEMGANSIQMIRVHRRLSDLLARKIPLAKLYEHPNVNLLAAYLAEFDAARPEPGYLPETRAASRSEQEPDYGKRRRRIRQRRRDQAGSPSR
ncbi:Amino acid adenylation domain-containing protein [Sulfidibacter corallicola]|uniref:L-cysteine--[L-cysteinyl-carrier protein] ligase n=1 Tax=Sulfidibacter corallicola TaxID=2818388 RepID=A0A8A4TLR1_SULCO|nr:non-ribosomal peptide synthetase [Sulfidibacter corallicola]QTD50042.1 amino acid adenylation domain-containing protein [Sulfidibacter corallicola]